MNINYMRTFLVALETGSFSATARHLGLTQPAVSMQIQALEDYFGAKLIERQGRKLELTRAGVMALQNIKASLDLVDLTRRNIDELATEVVGPVLVGASTVPGEHLCPLLMGIFIKRYPMVKPRLIIENTSLVLARLHRHELDVAIVGAPPKEFELHAEPIFHDELILFIHPAHRLATKAQVSLDDVHGEPFIGRTAGSGSRLVLERELARHGLSAGRLMVVLEVSTSLAAVNAVEAGVGLAFVSSLAAGASIRAGRGVARRLEGLTFSRALHLVTSPRLYNGRAVAEMAKFLRSTEARAVGEGRQREWQKLS
ncbi:MAG: HTH-type transcriptional activator CmpR [Firmicutes bacterium]|nr:HTH-type transcriptional activator CmpR [Bacillota bacterium]